MNVAAIAVAVVLFTGDVTQLVLKSGHKMPIDGPVRVEKGAAVFRHASGVLYSLPLSEIDVAATEEANGLTATAPAEPKATEESKEKLRLAVTPEQKEKLLRDLEKSRGTPVPQRPLPSAESLVSDEIDVRERDDEEYWRSESRRLEENLRRRRDDIELQKRRLQRLEDEIRMLVGSGTPTDQFAGNIMQLEDARAALDQAYLDLERAERELGDFRDRARQLGILPGWLR